MNPGIQSNKVSIENYFVNIIVYIYLKTQILFYLIIISFIAQQKKRKRDKEKVIKETLRNFKKYSQINNNK